MTFGKDNPEPLQVKELKKEKDTPHAFDKEA